MPGKGIKNSIGLRLLIIGFLTLILLIPSIMIMVLVEDRQSRRVEVEQEVRSKWARSQAITGPVVTIPYLYHSGSDKGYKKGLLHLLPEELNVSGRIKPSIRYRSIYKVALYEAEMDISGFFNLQKINNYLPPKAKPLFDEAYISLGITDMHGISSDISLNYSGIDYTGEPGLPTKDIINTGIRFVATLNPEKKDQSFKVTLNLKGSNNLKIVPVGKETRVTLKSDWSNPSFSGEYLPVRKSISDKGFEAEWKVLHFNRDYPQSWVGNKFKVLPSAFGVTLFLPVDSYHKTERTLKYAILFIGMTFLSFFIVEVLNKKILHPVQYILIGSALVLFYSLLLSLSEHIRFEPAYLISSLSIISLISFYSRYALKSVKMAGVLGGILSLFYLFLYVLLQLQDYSILVGSFGLLLVLAIIMYTTRNIDWFAISSPENREEIKEKTG